MLCFLSLNEMLADRNWHGNFIENFRTFLHFRLIVECICWGEWKRAHLVWYTHPNIMLHNAVSSIACQWVPVVLIKCEVLFIWWNNCLSWMVNSNVGLQLQDIAAYFTSWLYDFRVETLQNRRELIHCENCVLMNPMNPFQRYVEVANWSDGKLA